MPLLTRLRNLSSDLTYKLAKLSAVSLILLCSGCASFAPGPKPLVILVGIDGLSPSTLTPEIAPHLTGLASQGLRANGMRPSFPSDTFPNFYTLVTGLRPDHHGIVANNMESADIPGVRFALSNVQAVADRRWWDGGEPIWVTAQNQGLRSGTMFWVGSEAAIQGQYPTIRRSYDGKVTPPERVDTALSWLDLPPDQKPHFLTLYFEDVDKAGHEHGPNTPEVKEALARVDRAIGQLLAGLKARNIAANIVVVSDHGMAAVNKSRVVLLDSVVNLSAIKTLGVGAHADIVPVPGKEAEAAAGLLRPHANMQCWRKQDIPAALAYGTHARIPPIICLAEPGWLILSDARALERARENGGAHGYDPRAPEMLATFFATGPSIQSGQVDTIDNVDVYGFVMGLLGVTPKKNDGQPERLLRALRALR